MPRRRTSPPAHRRHRAAACAYACDNRIITADLKLFVIGIRTGGNDERARRVIDARLVQDCIAGCNSDQNASRGGNPFIVIHVFVICVPNSHVRARLSLFALAAVRQGCCGLVPALPSLPLGEMKNSVPRTPHSTATTTTTSIGRNLCDR